MLSPWWGHVWVGPRPRGLSATAAHSRQTHVCLSGDGGVAYDDDEEEGVDDEEAEVWATRARWTATEKS